MSITPIDQVIESIYQKYLSCIKTQSNENEKAKIYQEFISDLFFAQTGKNQDEDPAGYLAFWSRLGEKFAKDNQFYLTKFNLTNAFEVEFELNIVKKGLEAINDNDKTKFENTKKYFLNIYDFISKLLNKNKISCEEFNYLMSIIKEISKMMCEFEKNCNNKQQSQTKPPKPKNTP